MKGLAGVGEAVSSARGAGGREKKDRARVSGAQGIAREGSPGGRRPSEVQVGTCAPFRAGGLFLPLQTAWPWTSFVPSVSSCFYACFFSVEDLNPGMRGVWTYLGQTRAQFAWSNVSIGGARASPVSGPRSPCSCETPLHPLAPLCSSREELDRALSEAEKLVEESNRIERNRIEVQQLEAKLLRFVVGRTSGRDGPSPPILIRRDGVGGT